MPTYDVIWCNIYFSENFPAKIKILGRIQKINENWDLPYSACFIICEIPSNETRIPKYVSISNVNGVSTETIAVQNGNPSSGTVAQFIFDAGISSHSSEIRGLL